MKSLEESKMKVVYKLTKEQTENENELEYLESWVRNTREEILRQHCRRASKEQGQEEQLEEERLDSSLDQVGEPPLNVEYNIPMDAAAAHDGRPASDSSIKTRESFRAGLKMFQTEVDSYEPSVVRVINHMKWFEKLTEDLNLIQLHVDNGGLVQMSQLQEMNYPGLVQKEKKRTPYPQLDSDRETSQMLVQSQMDELCLADYNKRTGDITNKYELITKNYQTLKKSTINVREFEIRKLIASCYTLIKTRKHIQ